MAKTNGNTKENTILTRLQALKGRAGRLATPRMLMLLGALAAAIAAAVVFAPGGKPYQVVANAVRKPTLPELMEAVKANPKDARAHLELAFTMWELKNEAGAIKEFDIALGIDPSIASTRLAETLTSCFGEWCQTQAGAILGLYKVEQAEPKLVELTKSPVYSVRMGAVYTLEKMGKTEGVDYVGVYALALNHPECEVKRRAVDKLSAFSGNQRALSAIRVARHKEQRETPWYAFDCIGGRADDAEKKILAHR